ncbi:8-amino-7-oxononanoate synthase [Phakopsora pachyrhizi]|uniref:8-amino-7-oxononanoate synthase n=1 Tax=Phakopsora pachyrhizi TaxID=170000 RepID=A0AAV0AHG7_PHAPC|nr:8-amino-7-oxononanoate synthase [Phakopsora pachyrhizi]CAH7666636.1 8-amino-7-oxononanoate synthase [Phakopsora pachyrhizi]
MTIKPSSLENRLRLALDSRQARSILRSLDSIPLWVYSEEDDNGKGRQILTHKLGARGQIIQAGNKSDSDILRAKKLIDFSSNDYLSLSRSAFMQQELKEKLFLPEDQSPFGPSSSRLLDGNTIIHQRLEKDLSEFFLGKSALLFNSGFDANVGIWSTIPGPDDWVVYDRLIHASVHDGLRLSRTRSDRRIPFQHNSPSHLKLVLDNILSLDPNVRSGKTSVFISVESLYSMDGDLCPLEEFVTLVEKAFEKYQNAYLIVDEAHSTGLYGSCGRGLVCALSLSEKILVRLHTFGKAAACSGAVVLAPPILREYLINYARPLIFSTAMTRMSVIAIETVISEFKSVRRQKAAESLESLSHHFSNQLSKLLNKHQIKPLTDGNTPRPRHVILTVPQSSLDILAKGIFSPIVPILSHKPHSLARFLFLEGYLLRPIGTPTVPPGRELVRVCLHANQTTEQIDNIIGLLDCWIKQHSSIQKSHL